MQIKINNIPFPFGNPIDTIRDTVAQHTKEILLGIVDGIHIFIVDTSYSIALIGGGISIILWLGGWSKGKRAAGILFVSHVLIRFFLG